MEAYTRNHCTINIDYDEYPEDPTNWGNFTVTDWRHTDGIDADERSIDDELNAKIEDGRAFWVSKYEHSAVTYSLAYEGMQDRWDTTNLWGIIEFDDAYIENTTYEQRKEYARGDLATYTQWANGEVYRFTVEDEDGDIIDSCSGYYTEQEAMDEANDAADNYEYPRDSVRAVSASKLHA